MVDSVASRSVGNVAWMTAWFIQANMIATPLSGTRALVTLEQWMESCSEIPLPKYMIGIRRPLVIILVSQNISLAGLAEMAQ